MNELNWTYNEFLAFLLIYVSHVDMDFAEEEKMMIKKSVGEPTYTKMLAEFDAVSDYKAYQTILNYKPIHYPNPDQKEAIMGQIKDLFHADLDFNIMEKELLHFLEKMM